MIILHGRYLGDSVVSQVESFEVGQTRDLAKGGVSQLIVGRKQPPQCLQGAASVVQDHHQSVAAQI